MGSLGGSFGNGGIWGMRPFHSQNNRDKQRRRRSNSRRSSESSDASAGSGRRFPVKPAATAAALALTGDTIAQLCERWTKNKAIKKHEEDVTRALLLDHNWLRALRISSYGFLLYGPGSYVWYQYLDHLMPKQTVQNVLIKVILNQIVLGPCAIAVVFAWNNLWQRKLSELPNKYKKDALPTLLFGFRFWIPVSVINFWAIPLQARVAFMSLNSIFWNFYLSSALSK